MKMKRGFVPILDELNEISEIERDFDNIDETSFNVSIGLKKPDNFSKYILVVCNVNL